MHKFSDAEPDVNFGYAEINRYYYYYIYIYIYIYK